MIEWSTVEFTQAIGATLVVNLIDHEPYLITITEAAPGVVRVRIERHPEHIDELLPPGRNPLAGI